MNNLEPKISPVAERIFKTEFIPYIVEKFRQVAKISYLSSDEARDKWRFAYGFNAEIANYLLHAAGMFYILHFNYNDSEISDFHDLHDLSTLMARYMAPYFAQAKNTANEDVAFEKLKQELYYNNTFIVKQISRIHQRDKRKRRKNEKNQLIFGTAIIKTIDVLIEILNNIENPVKRKRARIGRDKINIKQYIKENKKRHTK